MRYAYTQYLSDDAFIKSSDDHEIEKWEWTKKKPEGEAEELPADITGARSPYLTVRSWQAAC